LSREYARVEALTVEKDESISCLEKRVCELEKSNEIFKYRIIEMKNVSDPKEEEILKLKDNMVELEQEYEKITKRAHDYEQNITLLKKDILQTRNQLTVSLQKERKVDKNYCTVIDKIREATKAPIQEIRKMLIKVLEQFDHPVEGKQLEERRSNSPLGELNRVREHLEICLMEVV
jgi:chromosome segregation ATPase